MYDTDDDLYGFKHRITPAFCHGYKFPSDKQIRRSYANNVDGVVNKS